MSNFHKRHFDLKFDRAIILVRKSVNDDAIHKKIPVNSIRSCTIKNENEHVLDENGAYSSTGFKRSRSWLSKMRKTDDETCVWNFCFELELSDRTMELFAPTRMDREKWVEIFNLICEMNDRLISTKSLTPLAFKAQKEAEAKKKADFIKERENFHSRC